MNKKKKIDPLLKELGPIFVALMLSADKNRNQTHLAAHVSQKVVIDMQEGRSNYSVLTMLKYFRAFGVTDKKIIEGFRVMISQEEEAEIENF